MRVSTVALLGFPLVTATSSAGMAANVNQPYQNLDKTNDNGNDTGASRVESLNGAQSDHPATPQSSGQTAPASK